MFGVGFSQTYREPVPGMRCTGSNPPVGLHAGTTSSPLHTQRAHNSPPETTPTQGWPVAFGGVSEGARWMPASHSEVRVVEPLTSAPQPSNSWRGRMSHPCLSLPSFRLHFSFIFISGHLENLIAVISILSRLIGIGERKAFFFFFLPDSAPEIKSIIIIIKTIK